MSVRGVDDDQPAGRVMDKAIRLGVPIDTYAFDQNNFAYLERTRFEVPWEMSVDEVLIRIGEDDGYTLEKVNCSEIRISGWPDK